MEKSDSASEQTGWIPNHLGEIEHGKLKISMIFIELMILHGIP